MNFVDRANEQERIKRLLGAELPGFVIVRGRRRVGKSSLIKRILNDDDIYFEADRTDKSTQIANLSYVISHRFPGFSDAVYRDWRAVLTALNYRVEERLTLCLDEFPYLADNDSSLPSVIQTLLDSGSLRYNLILCGSSQEIMYDLTHDERSPLYGRSVADFKVGPIRIPYLSEALHLDGVGAIENFAVWGGIPRYWKLRESSGSLAEAINEHILSNNGILYEEPYRLFRDDVKDIVKTATLMTIVGGGATRLKEIAAKCNEPSTNLSRPLAKLIDLGYLEKDVPFGESLKNSKKTLYRIADPFLSFHYRFIPANRSFIELERRAPVDAALAAGMPSHIGYWWERICRDAVTGNTIDGITYGEARRWWGCLTIGGEKKDVEIDVVAESLDKKTILLGECKWTSSENGRLLTRKLEKLAAVLPFCKDKEVRVVLFTKTTPEEDQGNCILPDRVVEMYLSLRLPDVISAQ